ncbi:MAG: methyltransferase family protein, partial [Candidatus Hodarchaeota archaeon]
MNHEDNHLKASNDFKTYDRRKEYSIAWIWSILLVLEGILSFMLQNPNRFEILFWIGWGVWGLGALLVAVPFIIFPRKGGVPEGKSMVHTTILVNTGIYSIVRHPQYLGGALIMFSLILFSQHWLVAVIGLPGIILLYITTVQEDKFLLKKFGIA